MKLEADDASVGPMEGSIPTGDARSSHKVIYTWIHALPKGELARLGVMVASNRTSGQRPKKENTNRLIREYLPKGIEIV